MTSSTPPEDRADAARDPWLQQALRHAPDADLGPAAQARETVLRHAREALLQPPRPAVPALPWWRRWSIAWGQVVSRPQRLGYSGALVVLLVVAVWAPWAVDEELQRERGHLAPIADTPPATTAITAAPASAVVAAPAAPEQARPSEPTARARSGEKAAKAPAAPTGPLAPAPQVPALPSPQVPAAPSPQVPAAAAPLPATPPAASPPPAAPAAAPSMPPPMPALATAERLSDAQPMTSAAARTGALMASAPVRLDPLAQTPDLTGGAFRWALGERSGTTGPAQQEWLQRLRARSAGCWLPAPAGGPVQPQRTLRLLAGEHSLAQASIDADGLLWWNLQARWWRCTDRSAAAALDEAAHW